jgi:N-acetyl-alpha-D-muramate 1-phosphate uridylyltransferase
MQIKKAMILGAGYGKRMLPLTNTIPKPLIKIGTKNLLERSIELLIKIGIKEIVLNIYHLSNEIERFVKHKNYNVSMRLIKEQELLDTGGGILNATKEFKDDPFFVLNPDTIWNKNYYEELKVLENLYFANKKPVLLLIDKKKSHDKSFNGDFSFINDKIITRQKENNYIYTGAQIIDRSIFSNMSEKFFSMNLIWDQLIQKQALLGYESNQTFFHVNSIEVFRQLEKLKFID